LKKLISVSSRRVYIQQKYGLLSGIQKIVAPAGALKIGPQGFYTHKNLPPACRTGGGSFGVR